MSIEGNYVFVYLGANRLGIGLFTVKGEQFHGTLVRTDSAINPTSRTLLAEVASNNTTILDPDLLCEANAHAAQCEHLRLAISQAHQALRKV